MHKIIIFLKTNYFIKGLILIATGFIVFYIRGALLIKADVSVGYGFLKLIGDIFWLVSLVFLLYSIFKDKLGYKIISIIFVFLLSLWFIQDIILETKYGVESYKNTYKDVTKQYSICLEKREEKLIKLQEESLKNLTPEEWQQLQKDYIQADLDLVKCLNEIFKGRVIYTREINQ